jgi:hypothetical protein
MIHDYGNEAEMSESLRVGAYGWRHDHWQPDFYDDELPEDWRLTFYANEFSTVLVPASYLDKSRDIKQWCEDVNGAFRFYFEWPQQLGPGDPLLQEIEKTGERLGGILLSSNIQLDTDCPVYNWNGECSYPGIWQPNGSISSSLAVFAIEQYDLRQQRQWLESFMEASNGNGQAVLLSDPELDIKNLHELKTLIELKGF